MQPNVEVPRKTCATVLSRALQPIGGDVPPDGARFILNLGIRDEDKKQMLDLLAKQQQGRITTEESEHLESYIEADNILSILRAQAVLVLKKAGQEP